jgi:exosome complex component RRP43
MELTIRLLGAVSTANGSALVRLGDTTIVCGIKAEVAEPDWKTPNHGWIGTLVRLECHKGSKAHLA